MKKVYPARHNLVHEISRTAVMEDLVDWNNVTLAADRPAR